MENSKLGKLQGYPRRVWNIDKNHVFRYELTVTKYDFGSSLRDALRYHNGAAFSTIDEDQDQLGGSCAQKYGGGGWWYRACYHASLNGRIEEGGAGGARAATWFGLKVKASTMKIRKIEN